MPFAVVAMTSKRRKGRQVEQIKPAISAACDHIEEAASLDELTLDGRLRNELADAGFASTGKGQSGTSALSKQFGEG